MGNRDEQDPEALSVDEGRRADAEGDETGHEDAGRLEEEVVKENCPVRGH